MQGWCRLPSPHFNATEEIAIRELIKARTPEELIALLSAVATAILAVIIVMMLYFGREIIIPIFGNPAEFRAGASRWSPPTHTRAARAGSRERRYYRLRTHIRDG